MYWKSWINVLMIYPEQPSHFLNEHRSHLNKSVDQQNCSSGIAAISVLHHDRFLIYVSIPMLKHWQSDSITQFPFDNNSFGLMQLKMTLKQTFRIYFGHRSVEKPKKEATRLPMDDVNRWIVILTNWWKVIKVFTLVRQQHTVMKCSVAYGHPFTRIKIDWLKLRQIPTM